MKLELDIKLELLLRAKRRACALRQVTMVKMDVKLTEVVKYEWKDFRLLELYHSDSYDTTIRVTLSANDEYLKDALSEFKINLIVQVQNDKIKAESGDLCYTAKMKFFIAREPLLEKANEERCFLIDLVLGALNLANQGINASRVRTVQIIECRVQICGNVPFLNQFVISITSDKSSCSSTDSLTCATAEIKSVCDLRSKRTEIKALKHSESHGWVEQFEPPAFSDDGDSFLTILPQRQHDSSYWRHAVAITNVSTGKPRNVALTSGRFVVTEIVSWDQKNSYLAQYVVVSVTDDRFLISYEIALVVFMILIVRLKINATYTESSYFYVQIYGRLLMDTRNEKKYIKDDSIMGARNYYLATTEEESAVQHLYRISTRLDRDRKPKCLSCGIVRDTDRNRCLYNTARFSTDHSHYVLTCAGPGVPDIAIYRVSRTDKCAVCNHTVLGRFVLFGVQFGQRVRFSFY
ncbi:Venom dipeptidyl peptidase 4 [Melipona quadrifasciata]|uniref:Venom dipeptidyl peptidase 4 n=1 Tax=Melipona quadrifasciata TaxID=166423 RepID=A0A0N0BBE9_9HYME|nr:Venom dipeptidyl peptidase 4 [Melipona quadrifasciata]